VAKAFIEDGYRKLAVGGRMVMVTKRLDWYKNKLTSVFGGVKVFEKEDYYIFLSEKRAARAEKPKKNAQTMSKKLQRKYGKRTKEI
jgi:16S rRNA (guanine1207-N2)-methyltransferase